MKIGVMLRHEGQHHGGVRVYTENLLPQMLALGTDHEFILMHRDSRFIGSYGEWEHVQEMAISAPSTLLWDQVAVPRVGRKEKFDIIFNPKFSAPLRSPAETVFVMHGSEWFVIPESYLWYNRPYTKVTTPLFCRSAAGVIAVSDKVKDDIVKFTGVNREKVFAVHNGYDPDRFHVIHDSQRLESVRENYHLPEHFILWVGQMYPPKNLGRLLKALAQVKDDICHALVIAGEQRWRAEGDLELIERLGIRNRVHFTGWVSHDDLPAFYNLADLFVLPSLYEGFGIPLLEAMACGCPVVTSTTCSPPEVVGGAGFLVDPLDVNEVAAGICEVLCNSELRNTLATRGLERAKEFSWEKCARQTLEVLESVGP
jgi:glycosyltransferase involved in cell wall biosynthesis